METFRLGKRRFLVRRLLDKQGRCKRDIASGGVIGTEHEQSSVGSALTREIEGVNAVGGGFCAKKILILWRVNDEARVNRVGREVELSMPLGPLNAQAAAKTDEVVIEDCHVGIQAASGET